MKKINIYLLLTLSILFIFCGCNSQGHSTSSPQTVVNDFLQAMQKQDYASAKNYYSENVDNMANFKNQIEVISPKAANELFRKMAAFTYSINSVLTDSNTPDKATVNVTIESYDLGAAFEKTVLDYIKSDLQLTFDGAKNEEIIKQTDALVSEALINASDTFFTYTEITLTRKDGSWQVDKVSDNPKLLNALSGNIISTIDKISKAVKTTE